MTGFVDAIKVALGIVVGILLMLIYNLVIHDPIVRASARSEYVTLAEHTALIAKRDEMQRQINAGNFVIESYQAQLRNARTADAERAVQIETEIADYERKLSEASRSCLLNSADIDWLRK